jgi:hypothetical protein
METGRRNESSAAAKFGQETGKLILVNVARRIALPTSPGGGVQVGGSGS